MSVRGGVNMTPEIPLDLQIIILKRLPMKSLARFKCVSKQWSSLISSQGYLFPSPPRLFISLQHDSDIEEEEFCSTSFELSSLSLESTSNSNNSTVFNLDWSKQGIGGYYMVVLRGLILYTVCEKPYIYNPTTGQRVALPTIEFINIFDTHYYFLGYDTVLDQYKILCSGVTLKRKILSSGVTLGGGRIYSHYWVIVLEAGSSWKRIEFDQPLIPSYLGKGWCINGVIYYFAARCTREDEEEEEDAEVICFDLGSEEFNIIKLPHETSDLEYLGIIEYGGKPTLFDCMELLSGMVNFWVLEDAGKWSKKSLVVQPCHMHFFAEPMSLIGSTQKGEVILQPDKFSSPYYILYYDMHKNDVRRVDIRGIPEKPDELALMDTGESIMHLKI